MFRQSLFRLILPVLLVWCLPSRLPAAIEAPPVKAAAVMLVDARTGRVLYHHNALEPRPVASTQKLLTALIVAEEGNLWKPVRIMPEDTQAEPTKLYLKPGQMYSRYALLKALLVKSANDAAVALARDNAGSVERFAAKMNARAARLGASNSHFVNPNGLPEPAQHSTARDMAIIARSAYFNPVLREIMQTKAYSFRYADGGTRQLVNTNRVLRLYPYCNGMKTGYTNAAGHCLISSGRLNGRDVIAVVLGSNKARIWNESASLLAWGLSR